MSVPKVSNKRMRDIQRAVHILAAALLFVYIYSPAGDAIVFERIIQILVIPVLTLTGLLLWQLPRIRKALRSRASSTSSGG